MKYLVLAVLFLGLNAQAWQDDEFNNYGIGSANLQSTQIACASKDYKTRQCGVNGIIRHVTLARQDSKTACIQGQTFSFNTYNVVVSGGCRGVFEVLYYANDNNNGGYRPDPSQPTTQVINCGSRDYKYNSCYTNGVVAFVELVSQQSNTACIQGSTYGASYDRIWVDKGCAGNFRVFLR